MHRKQQYILLFVVAIFAFQRSFAYEVRPNVFSYNLMGSTNQYLLKSNVYHQNISYERVIKPYLSVELMYEQGIYKYSIYKDKLGATEKEYWMDGKGAAITAKLFPFFVLRKDEAPLGFSFCFSYHYLKANRNIYEPDKTATLVKTIHEKGIIHGVGLDIGYKYGNIFTIEPTVGFIAGIPNKLNTNDRTKYFFKPGVFMLFNFQIKAAVSF